jgi:RNA polymerase-binding transcription factor DksA
MEKAMTDTSTIAAALKARLIELTGDIADIETALQAPLDPDFSEQANELEEQDALSGIEAVHRAEIAEIRAALARLDAGSYGRCRVCDTPIPAGRLAALPTATTCLSHATG